ncbi:unnamed protein product [Thlaspi arvense]|uniref:C-JID domain-containing protein n=1 Tax=Thlaspi arvense TaxID=13288 RepID=A0AAU9RMW3_THLAR|nr:unnamed protein product [Thlaspi arvense]
MINLRFLKFYKKSLERKKDVRWYVPERFNDFPDKLKLLSWPGYPMECLPSDFCPEYLVELKMPNSKLQLAEVRWPDKAQDTNDARTNLSLIIFTNCFNLNQEAFIQQSASEYLILPGVEVPLYFTHRSTGRFLTVPLRCSTLSQQSFLDFKACVVVHCRFRDKHGNYFEPAKPRYLSLHQKYNHLIIFDCHFPLNQDYNQVEIEFRLASIRLKLKGCGVRLSDDTTPFLATHNEVEASGEELEGKERVMSLLKEFSSPENRFGNPNACTHVFEADNMVDDRCHETEEGEECGDSDVDTKRSRKRMRFWICLVYGDKKKMAEQQMKPVASLLLLLNFCMYAIVLGIGAWSMNKAINHGFLIGADYSLPAHFSPIYFPMGNAATGFFMMFALIAGVAGAASVISGVSHLQSWTTASLPAAVSAATIAWSLTRTMEAFLIILSATQLIYIAAIYGVRK